MKLKIGDHLNTRERIAALEVGMVIANVDTATGELKPSSALFLVDRLASTQMGLRCIGTQNKPDRNAITTNVVDRFTRDWAHMLVVELPPVIPVESESNPLKKLKEWLRSGE